MEDDRLFPYTEPEWITRAKSAATPKPRPHELRKGPADRWANQGVDPFQLAGYKSHGLDSRKPRSSDFDAKTLFTELQAALVVAVHRGGDIRPALEIADSIIARRLMDGPRGRLLAHGLVELSLKHRATAADAPDPYAQYGHHLRSIGLCSSSDFDIAFMGRVLLKGMEDGSLPARQYDMLASAGDDDPVFRELLGKIERLTD